MTSINECLAKQAREVTFKTGKGDKKGVGMCGKRKRFKVEGRRDFIATTTGRITEVSSA